MPEGEGQTQSEWEKAAEVLRAEIQAAQQRTEQQIGGLAQGVQYIAQQTGVAQQAEQERLARQPLDPRAAIDANERLRRELWENPTGVFAQAIQIGESRATQRAQAAMEAERQRQQAVEGERAFWDAFFAGNPQVDRIHEATIKDLYARVPPSVINPSERANQARDWLMERLGAQYATMQEQERRRTSDAQTVSTGTMAGDYMAVMNPEGATYSTDQHTEDYVAARKAKYQLITGGGGKRTKAA